MVRKTDGKQNSQAEGSSDSMRDRSPIVGVPAYIKGFFTILAGLFFIVFPDSIAGVVGIIFGIVLMVAGIAGTANYIISIKNFRDEGYGQSVGAEILLVYSVIVMIIGFVFMLKLDLVMQIISLITGLFFLIDGIVKIREATLVPSIRSIYWWITLLLSIAIFVAGLAIVLYPFNGTRAIVIFSGLCFIASGIETLVLWYSK